MPACFGSTLVGPDFAYGVSAPLERLPILHRAYAAAKHLSDFRAEPPERFRSIPESARIALKRRSPVSHHRNGR
jgi:hypothetical protein